MKFCKKIACTNLIENDLKYCKDHTPIPCNFPTCKKFSNDDTGLCNEHLKHAKKYIESKKVTLEKLQAKGLINKGVQSL